MGYMVDSLVISSYYWLSFKIQPCPCNLLLGTKWIQANKKNNIAMYPLNLITDQS